MRLEHRIPTILGLVIILSSLVATGFFLADIRTYLGRASPSATPLEIKTSNISDSSFTVSWITSESVSGTVSFGEDTSGSNMATDDRGQVPNKAGQYTTHHITLKYLKPATEYHFKIISGGGNYDNNGQDFIVTTAPKTTDSSSAKPVFGTVKKYDNTPAEGSIVYVTVAGTTLLSTPVKPSGSWLIPLNNTRTADLADFAKIPQDSKLDIFVQGGNDGTAAAVAVLTDDSPIPQISLGKSYNFTQPETTTTPIISTASPF